LQRLQQAKAELEQKAQEKQGKAGQTAVWSAFPRPAFPEDIDPSGWLDERIGLLATVENRQRQHF
jgi:hypothetical protein